MLDTEALNELGMHEGAMASARLIKNAGWYNGRGDKLGWGDVGIKEAARLKAELPLDDPFFLLGEQDSYWSFVTHNTGIAQLNETSEDVDHPGFRYVMDHSRFIFFEGEVYAWQVPSRAGESKDYGYHGEFMVMGISQDDLRQKLMRFGAMVRGV